MCPYREGPKEKGKEEGSDGRTNEPWKYYKYNFFTVYFLIISNRGKHDQ